MIGSCVPLVQTPCWINELTKKQDKWLLGCIHLNDLWEFNYIVKDVSASINV